MQSLVNHLGSSCLQPVRGPEDQTGYVAIRAGENCVELVQYGVNMLTPEKSAIHEAVIRGQLEKLDRAARPSQFPQHPLRGLDSFHDLRSGPGDHDGPLVSQRRR